MPPDPSLRDVAAAIMRMALHLTNRLSEDQTSSISPGQSYAFNFRASAHGIDNQKSNLNSVCGTAHTPLPDARLVRRIIRQRQLRARYFDSDLFADPAWDMLLDLTAARAENKSVSVTSLCIAAGVPPTTALRWIGQMIEEGLFERVEDDSDRRRAFITLTDQAVDALSQYFLECDGMGFP